MGSKRNKLLIFLGLITIAVSKSHNQRFDFMRQHDFETARTSASHPTSANSRLADATHLAKSSRPYDANDRFSEFVLPDSSGQKVDRLMRRVFEEEYDDVWPVLSEMTPSRDVQFSRRQGSVHEESTDHSNIDPQDFYFEPQKVKGSNKPSSKGKTAATLDGRSLSRRTGILIADTSKSVTGSKPETTTAKKEAKKETTTQPAKDATHEEQKTDDSKQQSDKKNAIVKKKKMRRKKVVRVRPRTQSSNNKTLANSEKKIVSGDKVKMISVSTDQKKKHPTAVKAPKKDSNIETQTIQRSPEIPIQKEVFQSNKTTSLKKHKVVPKNDTKSHDPEKKVAFFRRSGPKTGLPEQEQPKADWVSKYKNEDKNDDDNYYVLSFNYMGNKDDPAKDIQRLPQAKNVRKKANSGHDLQSKTPSTGGTGERPTAELNISHLEEVADRFLERQKSLVQNNAAHQNEYYGQKQDVPPVNDDDEYYDKTFDTSGQLEDDKSYPEKQYSPKVILKTKKAKKYNEPTWQLQSHKKKFPSEEWKTHKHNGNYEKQRNSRNRAENSEHRPNSGGYHVRSFIKRPSGDNVDIDFKQPFPTGEFKSIPRKPLHPLENKRGGNFFMHMYKQMGNIENFDVKHGNSPVNGGYLSSLRLTWTDDDTRARVEEALDSRAFLPKQPSYSGESIGSFEDSSRETFEPQPSENVMRFTSNDADDITSSLTGNKPFYFQDIPSVHRPKRSADNVPTVTSHFRMGNSKVENNYTLNNKPNARLFSKGTRLLVNNAAVQKQPKALINTQSGNTKRQSNVENRYSINYKPSDRLFSKRTGLLVNNRTIEQTKASDNTKPGNTNVQPNAENNYSLNYKPNLRLFSKRTGLNNSAVQEQPKAMTKIQSENAQFNLRSNYTLNYHPGVRLFSKRTGLIMNNAAVQEQSKASTNSQSGNVNVQPVIAINKQGNQNVKSYFLKPMESRGIQQLKSVFNITDIFNKYEKPSREMTNIQIFQTYQTPNRSPKQAHDLTYFHNDKNTQMKIKITDKVRTSRMDTAEPSLSSTNIKNSTPQNNFKTIAKSGVVQSSTEIKESYLKPEKETASKVLKQSTAEEKALLIKQTNQEETTENTPSIETRNDKTTTKSSGITEYRSTSKGTTSNYDVGSIVPTTERGGRENTKYIPKPILIDKETTKVATDKDIEGTTKFAVTKPYRATAKPVFYRSNRTTKASTVRKTKPATKSTASKSDRTTKNATITRSDRMPKYTAIRKSKTAKNVTARNDQLTSRPATVRKRKTTSKPTTVRNYQTTAMPTTFRNYQTTAKPTTATLRNDQTTSSTTSVKNDKTTSGPTTARNDHPTTRPTTARNDRTRKLTTHRNDQTTTKSYFNIATTTKPAIKTIKPETVGKARFFRKAGDIKERGTQASSTVEARRIDDKTWLYPQEQRDDENEELYDVEPELQKDHYRKQIDQHKDIPLPLEKEFQKSPDEIKPQIPFEWYNSVTPHHSHEIKYPTYHAIPKTRFTCKASMPGYYADPETSCQVFHMCHGNGVKHSFLCPNTTIFNQRLLVCDYYSKVHCEDVESYYEVSNSLLYKHAPRKTNDYEFQQKKTWNSQQNRYPITTKYASHTNRNHHQNNQQLTHNALRHKEINDMPQFIVKHFKENIPHAEFGRPKGVSKSYSAVISEPNTQQNQLPNNQADGHYINERPSIRIKSPNTEEKLIPDTFTDKYRAIKNSWNGREIQKTLRHELLRVPELRTHGNSFQRNLNPVYAPEKSKVIIPLIKKDSSYYVPNLEDEFGYLKNDDVHIAGRQNEKVIIVNRNRLKPDYDSSESEESLESDKIALQEALAKRKNSTPGVDNRTPYNTDLGNHKITIKNLPNGDAYQSSRNGDKLQASKDTYRSNDATRDQKQSFFDPRTTQYKQQYPLPGAVKSSDGSRDFNYDYRTEDPNVKDLVETQKQSAPRYNNDVPIENDAEEKNYIKTRIAEIKTGVDNIGAQISGILGGNDNTFKNVRIFKLKPDGSSGELEEIRLSPFKFERQSQVQKRPKLKEKKREDISIEVVQKDPRTQNRVREFNTYTQPKSINGERKPKTHSSFHANSNSKNGEEIAFLAVPKLLQNVAKEIAPRYNELSKFKSSKPDYEQNERLIQIVANNARARTTNTNKDFNLRNSHGNVNINPTDTLKKKNLPPRETLVNVNNESRVPTTSTYKEPTVTFTNTGMIDPGLDAKDFFPKYKNENSERFENMHVPKKNHGSDYSDSLNPIKTKLLKQKQLIKTQKENIEKFTAADGRQNTNYNEYNKEFNDNTNAYKPTNNNFNGKIPEMKFRPMQHTNEQENHHKTAMPHNDKRTFLVFSKPVTTTERHFNIPTQTVNNYPFNNYQTSRVPIQSTLNQDPSNECDDSTSNLNTFNALELGKNGPQKQHLNTERGAGNLKNNYHSQNKGASKCRDNSASKGQNQDFNKSPESVEMPIKNQNFYMTPTPNAAFKDLKQPAYAFAHPQTSPRFNSKIPGEAAQFKNKPVNLFEVPRNSRPAFTKPITAIVPAMPEARNNYYHRSQTVRDNRPIRNYQNTRTVRPLVNYQNPRRVVRPTSQYQHVRVTRPASHSQDDSRSVERSKRVTHGKNPKYATYEKEAEIKAIKKLPATEPKPPKIFSPARPNPQGKIVKSQKEHSDESDDSSNQKRPSRYAALEKAAELKAERMIKSKSHNKPKS